MSESETGTFDWIREQINAIEAAGDTRVVDVLGMSVVLLTTRGAKTGDVRKIPLMRIEHEGSYAAVASKGGAPAHPQWYYNLIAHPRITLQDGTDTFDVTARELHGSEREQWWQRCVAEFPNYAEYQRGTSRVIPVFALEPDATPEHPSA